MATEKGEVKEVGLQPVSVELPEGPPVEGNPQGPPPASGKAVEAATGDHGNTSGLPSGADVSPPAVGEEGGKEGEVPGGGETASLSEVVLGIMSQPRIIEDGKHVGERSKVTSRLCLQRAQHKAMNRASCM